METANIKTNSGVWFLNGQENPEGIWQVMSVNISCCFVPKAQSVQKWHIHKLGAHWLTDQNKEVLWVIVRRSGSWVIYNCTTTRFSGPMRVASFSHVTLWRVWQLMYCVCLCFPISHVIILCLLVPYRLKGNLNGVQRDDEVQLEQCNWISVLNKLWYLEYQWDIII